MHRPSSAADCFASVADDSIKIRRLTVGLVPDARESKPLSPIIQEKTPFAPLSPAADMISPMSIALPIAQVEAISNTNPLSDISGPRDIRAVKTLRISVTDRCNFRCVYCMPEEKLDW